MYYYYCIDVENMKVPATEFFKNRLFVDLISRPINWGQMLLNYFKDREMERNFLQFLGCTPKIKD